MKYRVAAVSFLNTLPLIDGLSADTVELTKALPSRLATCLANGEADVALVPVVEVFRGKAAAVVPDVGIACCGAVDSVKLFYNGDLSQLHRIRVDRGSRTSVALLDVLLREQHDLAAEFVEIEPTLELQVEPGEGLLVIGDRCFAYESALRERGWDSARVLDLGQAWWDMTGLPFVFAMWGVSGSFIKSASDQSLARLVRVLIDARDAGLERVDELAVRAAAAGRLGHNGEATAVAVAYYFRESLQFRLGGQEMQGLRVFQEMAVKHGVIPAGPLPTILRG